jgi:HEPN domain-containing protein
MSHLPEAKDDFVSANYYRYKASNEALQKNNFPDAYEHAMEWAENVMKAILLKNSLFIDKPEREGGDRHHSCEKLWTKIKSNNLIDESDIKSLNGLLPKLFKVNISSQSEHMDCASSQVPNFRYRDMDVFVNQTNAEEKVNLMNSAFEVLQKYLE